MNLADETMAFQALQAGVMAYPDDDELAEDLAKARAALERAWCETIGTLDARTVDI